VALNILIIFKEMGPEMRERSWSELWGCDTRAREKKGKVRKTELSLAV